MVRAANVKDPRITITCPWCAQIGFLFPHPKKSNLREIMILRRQFAPEHEAVTAESASLQESLSWYCWSCFYLRPDIQEVEGYWLFFNIHFEWGCSNFTPRLQFSNSARAHIGQIFTNWRVIRRLNKCFCMYAQMHKASVCAVRVCMCICASTALHIYFDFFFSQRAIVGT